MSRGSRTTQFVVRHTKDRPRLDRGHLRRRSPRRKKAHRTARTLDGDDLRPLPLLERKQTLRELVDGADHRIVYVDHIEARGEELLAGARALRLEGVVAKRADSAYVAGRSGYWRKVKVEETADFVVVGVAAPSESTFGRPALCSRLPETAGSGASGALPWVRRSSRR